MITPDEASFAGALWNTNNNQAWYSLNGNNTSIVGNNWWWVGNAAYYYATQNNSRTFVITSDGELYYTPVYNDSSARVRPVISLKSGVYASGSGTTADPYIIEGLL